MITLAITVFMAGSMITGCQSSSEKVKDAQDKVQAANEKVAAAQRELDQAIKDSIQAFKNEYEQIITYNDKKIAAFRVRINNEKKENRARYEQKLAELEQQNREMRKRLEAFNEEQKENWESLRLKFKHDMEEQGKAFRDFWTGKR